jgi:hypothetical protein
MESINKTQSVGAFHLAGIVPVAGQKLDFNFPWHDSMMPVAPNYLAVERAVFECAAAGCETIWVVCHREMQPLIRHRLGDWIHDPATRVAITSKYIKRAHDYMREVPIYYVPIRPRDRNKRDCLSWSVLFGAMRAYHVSKKISKWTAPNRYYVAFPYGVYDIRGVRYNRDKISTTYNSFFLSYNGKTVADGEYLGFTMNTEDFVAYRKNLRDRANNLWKPGSFWSEEERTIKGEILPVSERYTARNFGLDTVFGCAKLEGAHIEQPEWYYNISTWEGYRNFLSSENTKWVKRPIELKYHEWNPIGEDNEPED